MIERWSYRWTLARLLVAATMALCARACDKMKEQPRFDPMEPNSFFSDGMSARPPVEGTIARGQLRTDELLYTGKIAGKPADDFPFPITMTDLQRGRERFDIYCAACHGRTGDGDGMIARRGFIRPPSYFEKRLIDAPAGHFYDVITNGWGAMYSYNERVDPADRWRIAAYIRALQLSRNVPRSQLSQDDLQKLKEAGQ